MAFNEIANPPELAILTAFHAQVCRDCGIVPASPEGKDAAFLVFDLFRSGARTLEALAAALAAKSGRPGSQPS